MMKNVNDLIGARFGRWVIIKPSEDKVSPKGYVYKMVLCKCDCGNIKPVFLRNLLQGYSKSCGCLTKEQTSKRNYKHGKSNTRLFLTWENMRRRCRDQKNKSYHRYGGRGINVCKEWDESFPVFYDWAISHGYHDDLQIDRIDNNCDYTPDNCRWVDAKTQCKNRSSNVLITINGETKIMTEWCEQYGIDRDVASARIKSGWDSEKAVTTPITKPFKVIRFDCNGSIVEYSSVKEASSMNDLSQDAIRAVCTGRNKTCGGYKWKYVKNIEGA